MTDLARNLELKKLKCLGLTYYYFYLATPHNISSFFLLQLSFLREHVNQHINQLSKRRMGQIGRKLFTRLLQFLVRQQRTDMPLQRQQITWLPALVKLTQQLLAQDIERGRVVVMT